MITLFFWIVVFIFSLAVLILAADRFTKTAENIGVAMRIPAFIVGVTIVSIGTSLPELMTGLIATLKSTAADDVTSIVVANAMGSNIANILLISGICAVFAGVLAIKRKLINLDLPLVLMATALLAFIAWDGTINWQEGLILLVAYGVYVSYSLSRHSREEAEVADLPKKVRAEKKFKPAWIVVLLVTSFFIYIGAKYTIDSLIEIADIVGIASSAIALSAVAFGTSLPELVVSVLAVRRKEFNIAIGNIIGSNVFNATLVVGLPALIKDLTMTEIDLAIGIPFFIVSAILFTISGITKKMYSYEGAFYLLLYIVFIAKLFNLF
ncbi:MAG: calcium/sodium antiporter [bacterium]